MQCCEYALLFSIVSFPFLNRWSWPFLMKWILTLFLIRNPLIPESTSEKSTEKKIVLRIENKFFGFQYEFGNGFSRIFSTLRCQVLCNPYSNIYKINRTVCVFVLCMCDWIEIVHAKVTMRMLHKVYFKTSNTDF